MAADDKKIQQAVAAFDKANSADPNKEIYEGKTYPKELLYSLRMTQWLARMYPDASPELHLAARSQHICRWMIPRGQYPMDRTGYLKWRTDLKKFHAEKAGAILEKKGFEKKIVTRVQKLIKKEGLKEDAETQALEDAACLVFLDNYFSDFSKQHDEEKIIDILRKTWKKMSPVARDVALKLKIDDRAKQLVEKALKVKSET